MTMKKLSASHLSHIFILVLFGSLGDCTRQLTLQVNPYCNISWCQDGDNTTGYANLVYVRAAGEKDVFHYLWSTIGAPSILLVQTSPSAQLQINWTRMMNESTSDGAISFSEAVDYFYVVSLTNLWTFRDQKDTAKLDPLSNETLAIDFGQFIWDDINKTVSDGSSHCTAKFVTLMNDSSGWINTGGMLSLEMEAYGSDGRNDVLPRLQHTTNSTQIRIALDKMYAEFKESRFGVELLIATSDKNDDQLKFSLDRTIDDEYTPGVFKTAQLTAKSGGFLYWKPVVYSSEDLVITDSTDAKSYDVVPSNSSSTPYSIARAFLSDRQQETQYFSMSVSFGGEKDDFYNKTAYQVWTMMAGVGSVPEDKVSLMVIVVIAVGLGLPLLTMAVGGIYLLVDKFRKQKDDLLLSQDGR